MTREEIKNLNNFLIEQFEKSKRNRTSYLGKITQNISKIENSIALENQIITIKECLYELEKVFLKK